MLKTPSSLKHLEDVMSSGDESVYFLLTAVQLKVAVATPQTMVHYLLYYGRDGTITVAGRASS